MKRLFLALIVLASCSNCATWQSTTRKVLAGHLAFTQSARQTASQWCAGPPLEWAVNKCIERKQNPCPHLEKCKVVFRALATANTALSVGNIALRAGEEKTASAALQALSEAIKKIRDILKTWNVGL